MLVCTLLACGSSENEATAPSNEGVVSAVPESSTADAAEITARRCKPEEGTSGSPQTILQLVDLINGLPRPVTIPCLLESFDRPLVLNATANVISAQPAEGYRSPRMFLLIGPLSMSFVPEGDAQDFLELGEQTPDGLNSIKAEIHFPIEEPLEPAAPFKRLLRYDGGTNCGFCHYPETAVTSYTFDGAFVSPAYRPNPQFEVNFEYVKYQHEHCDAEAEPRRCDMYGALFGGGEVVRGEFPAQMPMFN